MAEKQNNTPWVLGFLAFIMIFNKAFGSGKEDKEGQAETDKLETAPLDQNPFLINSYKAPVKKGMFRFTINTQTATKAASMIDKGIGVMSDDEAMIINGIKMAGTKPDIYFIAVIYSRIYKRDLYTRLKQNLSRNKELGYEINRYVNKLPTYAKKGVKE